MLGMEMLGDEIELNGQVTQSFDKELIRLDSITKERRKHEKTE